MSSFRDTVGQVRTIGTSRRPWKIIRDGVTDTTALSQPAITETQPTYAFSTDDATGVRIRFGGTAAANKNFAYQVVLWSSHREQSQEDSLFPQVVAKGTVTLGALTYAIAGAMGAAANLLADEITDTLGYSGTSITPVTVDTCATLEVSTKNAHFVEVQLDLDGAGAAAATMDVFAQLGELGVDIERDETGEPFTVLIDGSALGSALTDPAPAATKAEVIGTAAHGIINTRGKSVARMIFGGTTTDGDIFNYQVILWGRVIGLTAEAWVPRVIANGTIIFGTDAYSATGTGMGAAGNLFADTITDTVLDGAVIYNTSNLRAVLEVPLLDSERIEVQTDKTTGDTADVFIQLSDGVAGGGGGVSGAGSVFYEDEAHVSGDPGRMFLCVQKTTRAALAADGDYTPPQLTGNGDMRVRDDDANTDLDTILTHVQAANTGYAAGDLLTPLGGVKSVARHTAAELETFVDDDYVPVGVTGVHELRVRDDDANTDLDTLVTHAQAANTSYAAGDLLTPLGGVKSVARHTAAELETFVDDDYVPVGVTGVHELRVRDDDANVDLAAIELLLAWGTAAMASAIPVTIATDDTQTVILTGNNLTFSRVPLITAGAATTEILAKTGSQYQRLHALCITVSAAALVEVEDKDGGVLATWNLGANGGIVIPFNANKNGAIQQTVVNKGLQIVNSAGNLGGYAVVSTATS